MPQTTKASTGFGTKIPSMSFRATDLNSPNKLDQSKPPMASARASINEV